MSSADEFLKVWCRVFHDVAAEAARASALHGDENPDGIRPDLAHLADTIRLATDTRMEVGEQSWCDILAEEFMEAVTEPDEAKRREELIQLAGVSVRWAESLDRRLGKRDPRKPSPALGWWERAIERIGKNGLNPAETGGEK